MPFYQSGYRANRSNGVGYYGPRYTTLRGDFRHDVEPNLNGLGRFDPAYFERIQEMIPAAEDAIGSIDRIGIATLPASMQTRIREERDYLARTIGQVKTDPTKADRTHYDRLVDLTNSLMEIVMAYRAGRFEAKEPPITEEPTTEAPPPTPTPKMTPQAQALMIGGAVLLGLMVMGGMSRGRQR